MIVHESAASESPGGALRTSCLGPRAVSEVRIWTQGLRIWFSANSPLEGISSAAKNLGICSLCYFKESKHFLLVVSCKYTANTVPYDTMMCSFSSVLPQNYHEFQFFKSKIGEILIPENHPSLLCSFMVPPWGTSSHGVHGLETIPTVSLFCVFFTISPVMLKWVVEMWEDLIQVISQIIVPRVWMKAQRYTRLCHQPSQHVSLPS